MSDKINAIFNNFKESVSLDPGVDISDVLAATAGNFNLNCTKLKCISYCSHPYREFFSSFRFGDW